MFVSRHVAIEVVRQIRPTLELIKQRDNELAKQLRDALHSVVLNLSEASPKSDGNKHRAYVVALGEAREAAGALDLAVAWGWIEEDLPVRKTLDRLLGLCWGLVHGKKARPASSGG